MRPMTKAVLALAFASTSLQPALAEINGKKDLICSAFYWNECSAQGCQPVNAEEIRAVRFINVDFGKKTISSRDPDDNRSSTIRDIENKDFQIVLQGAEYALAWTMTIDKADGEMTFSGARENVVFAAFGFCTVD